MKKIKGMNEKEFLALLLKVLPEATKDTKLANEIYDHVAKQVQLRNHVQSFEKFCEEGSLPDLEPATVEEFASQLTSNFGEENVTVVPNEEAKSVEIEIALPDRTITSAVKIIPPGEEDIPTEKLPFVPFPVVLPTDPELVWALARRENFAPDEAARSLSSIEEEYWATKAGQKLLKEIGERSFAEFIANVPAAALNESGLKRHYKAPQPLRTLRLLKAQAADGTLVESADSEASL